MIRVHIDKNRYLARIAEIFVDMKEHFQVHVSLDGHVLRSSCDQ